MRNSPVVAEQSVWLSRHVHVCMLGAGFVVLHIARDEYLFIEGVAAQCLAAFLPAWPEVIKEQSGSDAAREEESTALAQLIVQGVLTRSVRDARKGPVVRHQLSSASCAIDGNEPIGIEIQPGHVLVFLWAVISTVVTLRFRSLQSALNALERRKFRRRRQAQITTIEDISDLVAVFRRLRSFTFSAQRRCLFHAITLTRFLAYYGIDVRFVMGVKLDPWAAHSWIEYGDSILDSTPEQVRFYHPILVI